MGREKVEGKGSGEHAGGGCCVKINYLTPRALIVKSRCQCDGLVSWVTRVIDDTQTENTGGNSQASALCVQSWRGRGRTRCSCPVALTGRLRLLIHLCIILLLVFSFLFNSSFDSCGVGTDSDEVPPLQPSNSRRGWPRRYLGGVR